MIILTIDLYLLFVSMMITLVVNMKSKYNLGPNSSYSCLENILFMLYRYGNFCFDKELVTHVCQLKIFSTYKLSQNKQ